MRNQQIKEKSKEELFFETIQGISSLQNREVLNENANVDGLTPMGQMGKFGSETAKFFANNFLLNKEVQKAIKENFVHPHDLDFLPTGTTTCSQIPLGKVLKDGFNTGHGFMREPNDIHSAMALASIIFQSNQNMQHGGQSFPMFDYDLAPYVRKTFLKNLKRINSYPMDISEEKKEELAWLETEKDVYQSSEAFVHNCNSMHSRGGGQVPFVSINYGTDTSKEGRMVIKNMLLATKAGLGNGETPIFPIQVFKMKKGKNFEPSDPNYDLYKLSLEVTAKRLFPNYSFVDAPFNLQYYNGTPESEVTYMGCRTRVMGNIHGEENSIGRGNNSFTTINLVKLALVSSNMEEFTRNLNYYMNVTIQQLKERYEFQCKKQVKNFPFLYKQGVWGKSERLNENDTLEEILKLGTLSVGFIGLAEALVVLTGQHHGQSEISHKIGYEIVKFMRDKTDQATTQHNLNYSLIATPAEGLSGKFTSKDREEFGVIEGVTDREFYTNSFHVPVYYQIKAFDKIKKEGPFHELCNAGHISYIECDGDVSKNIVALDKLVKAMENNGFGYGSINHPVDRCKPCGYTGIIDEECPQCGNGEDGQVERIRRITGYLVGDMSKWNAAKTAEESQRVKHQ